MTDSKIYEDIATRTLGDIYVGVVGPVRTGKSSFIKRFMETLVIPNIDNVYARERARDELPQSGSGRTIMTAEPKFVPEDAVKMRLGGETELSVRLIDCVGYLVPGAVGALEDGEPRLVATPWFDEEIDLKKAAEEGTRRVIQEHSTVGIVVTTDGSICGIPRSDYLEAEQRVISELQAIGKPFVILLNSASPNSNEARLLARELEEKYSVACLRLNCLELSEEEIDEIFRLLLSEFPAESFSVSFPPWVDCLPAESSLRQQLFGQLMTAAGGIRRLRDASVLEAALLDGGLCCDVRTTDVFMGTGSFCVKAELPRELYYETLSEGSGVQIENDEALFAALAEFARIKAEYDRIAGALADARESGYGVMLPSPEEMTLSEPQIVRQNGKYCAVLRASAPAIHLLRTRVENEVKPAVGGENASEEIMGLLLQSFEGDVSQLWQSNIFGKSLYDIAAEGLSAKLKRLPDATAGKLRAALQKMVNEGRGGLICIIL